MKTPLDIRTLGAEDVASMRAMLAPFRIAALDGARVVGGIAAAMVEHLQALAPAKGAWVIYVQADCDDAAAISLYSKLGKREDVLHFDIPPARRG